MGKMSDRLKLLPAGLMLLAGLITSIEMFALKYSSKTALTILLVVLLVFYIIGLLLQKLIFKFETIQEEKRIALEKAEEEAKLQEGKVVEKDQKDIAKNADKQPSDEEKPEARRPDLDGQSKETE